jgi:hypothetical protein
VFCLCVFVCVYGWQVYLSTQFVIILTLQMLGKAEQYCPNCDVSFCEHCAMVTHSSKLLQSHKLCSIDMRKPKCKHHPDYFADMYCEDDKELICMKCHLVGKHKGHSVHDVQDISASIRDGLSKAMQNGNDLDAKLQEKVNCLAADVKGVLCVLFFIFSFF